MKCIDCLNAERCLDHKEQPSLIGCSSGIPRRKKPTQAARIRSMSDEELAEHFSGLIKDTGEQEYCEDVEDWLKWLRSEVEE